MMHYIYFDSFCSAFRVLCIFNLHATRHPQNARRCCPSRNPTDLLSLCTCRRQYGVHVRARARPTEAAHHAARIPGLSTWDSDGDGATVNRRERYQHEWNVYESSGRRDVDCLATARSQPHRETQDLVSVHANTEQAARFRSELSQREAIRIRITRSRPRQPAQPLQQVPHSAEHSCPHMPAARQVDTDGQVEGWAARLNKLWDLLVDALFACIYISILICSFCLRNRHIAYTHHSHSHWAHALSFHLFAVPFESHSHSIHIIFTLFYYYLQLSILTALFAPVWSQTTL